MRQFNSLQLISILLGLGVGLWLLVSTIQDYLWANQPMVAVFYTFDSLRDKERLDKDGLFHDPAFDELKGMPLTAAREKLEHTGFSCETLLPEKRTNACHYGYQTDTGCCRFRIVLDYSGDKIVHLARGDKSGRCGR